MSEVSKDYGNYIKERRISKGMSQAEVAKKLGISQVAYGRYELGISATFLPPEAKEKR